MNASGEGRFSYQLKLCVFAFSCVFLLIPHYVTHAGLTDGLVGHWTFDGKDTTWTTSTTGTTRDISGNGNTGTLTNMNRATAPKAGKIGQGLSFDGVNDSITSISASVREYTLSFWLKRQDLGVAGYNSVFSCTATTGSGYYGWYDSGQMRWCYTDSSGFALNRLGQSGLPVANKWVHIVMTVGVSGDNVSMRQFFNNSLINTDSTTSGLGTTTFATIGSGHINLKGILDDVRVYNRVLSASEITQLYKKGATKLGVSPSRNITSATSTCTGISCGLVGHWTFDGKDTVWTSSITGTTRDLSGSGNTGTLSAMNRATSPKRGKIGQAFMFSDASRVGTANYNILGTTASSSFTVSSWFNVASTTLNHMYIIEYGGGAAFVVEKVSSEDTMRCKVRDPGAGFLYSNSVARPQIGQWHLFSCVYNAANKTLVFNVDDSNNTPVSVSSFSSFDNPGQLFLGGRSYGTYNGFIGSLDDMRIYNRALSASEINQLYKTGATKLGVTPSRANATTTGTTGLGAGLVGHWTFDGKDTTWTSATAGTVRDVSGNGNTGTLTGMNRATAPKAGKIGQGIRFVASQSQDVTITATTPYTGTTMTFATWFRRADNLSTEQTFMYSDIGFGFNISRLAILDYAGGRFSSAVSNIPTPNTYTDMNWHHAVFTSDASGSKIYVDGLLATSSPITIVSTNSKNTGRIGSSNSRYFNGSLDDVRIYNRALSATEVQRLYKLGQTRMR